VVRAVALTIGLFLAHGCAGATYSPGTVVAAPCLPRSVRSQFFFWPVVAFQEMSLATEDGGSATASWVLYRKGKAAVATMWVHADLVSVDPSPETDAPEWVDLSLMIPKGGKLVLRSNPEPPCRWEHWEPSDTAFVSFPFIDFAR
jgi:hypothetical protein